MTSRELGRLLKPVVKSQFLIWAVFMTLVVVCCAAAYVVQFNSDGPRVTPSPAAWFRAGALLLAVGAVAFRRHGLGDARLRRLVECDADDLPSPFPAGSESGRLFAELEEPQRRVLALVAADRWTTIVSLALAEAVTILGLVLVVLEGRAVVIVPFAVVNLVLNILFAPRPVRTLQRAQELMRQA